MKRIGFVGVGCISGIYLKNITEMFHNVEIAGVCDLIPERAEAAREQYGVHVYKDMYELFADPKVDIVLNITRPYEHYEVTKAALLAGKHVYSEKPLSPDYEEAKELAALAAEKGLYLGGAPDTFLGAGIQTARKLIDDGFIGTPIAAMARVAGHGPETWHADPEFFYQYGGGPMLDMGPYYITALVNLLGRAEAVSGMTRASFAERPILSKAKYGQVMQVEVDTHLTGSIRFENGAIAQVMASFDLYTHEGCRLEIYGSEGTILVPDPNTFGGDVKLIRPRKAPEIIPLCFNYEENSRTLGLAEMVSAIETGRLHRANSMQQVHVVEILTAFSKSSRAGREIAIESPFERQAPMEYTPMTGFPE